MIDWLGERSIVELVLLALLVFVVLSIGAALLTRVLVRRGLHTPFAIRHLNQLSQSLVDLIRRPITIAVLDEVAGVIQTGHYTRNISAALVENHDELKRLVAEKVREDPALGIVGRLPGYDAIVGQVSETTLRVLIEMLRRPAHGRAGLRPAAQQPRADQERGARAAERGGAAAPAARPVAEGGAPATAGLRLTPAHARPVPRSPPRTPGR